MTKRLLLATLLCLGSATVASSQYSSVAPFGFDLITWDIVWASQLRAYGVANNGAGQTRSSVIRSDDNGDTWNPLDRDGVKLNDIDVIGEDVAITVGMSANCGCGVIEKTTDAGTSWSSQEFPSIPELTGLDFVTELIGYAVGWNGAVLKTTNGGTSWTNVGPGTSESTNFTEVSFPTSTIGYVVGRYTANAEPGRLYKTTDAGATWTKIMDQPGGTDKPVFYSVWATNPETVFLAGRETIRAIFRSSDGGSSWRRVYSGLPVPDVFSMNAVEFSSDSVGFAVGDYGTIVRSTNAGLTWAKEDPGTISAFAGLGMKDRNNGIVGGVQGMLMKRAVAERATIVVDPTALDFGKMTTGEKNLEVTISPANSVGLVITGIRVDDFDASGFTLVDPTSGFPMELAYGEEQTATVQFKPKAGLNERVFAQLTISTNDPLAPNKVVTLVADATAEESNVVIQVSTSSLEFGQLLENKTKDLTLEVSAGTEAVLQIDSVWIARLGPGGEAFSVQDLPVSGFPIMIPQGQPHTFNIRYNPTGPTEFPAAGEFVILSNDLDNTEVRVSLSGSAVVDPSGVEDELLRTALAIVTSPNPMTGSATVSMHVPSNGHLTARLYDSRGALTATLIDRTVAAGALSLPLDADSRSSGVYTLVVTLNGRTVSTRVAIAR